MSKNSFMYFGYGSNLLAKRLLMANPTAIRKTIGKLEGYRLDFSGHSDVWLGASATIVEEPKSHVYGAIWEIDAFDLKSLDKQEGVELNIYKPLEKSIQTLDGEQILCRLYQKVENPTVKYNHTTDEVPFERLPSKTYLDVIIAGAQESNVPSEYLNFLKTFKNNNQLASAEILKKLEW